jgi:thiol-disulfide isomerase/thioredoxin
MRIAARRAGLWLLLLIAVTGHAEAQRTEYAGTLHLAGGPLHFRLKVQLDTLRVVGRAEICNLNDCVAGPARWTDDSLFIHFPDYDAVIAAARRRGSLVGYYHNVGRLGPRTIPFSAARIVDPGFSVGHVPTKSDSLLRGSWDATFVTDGRPSPRVFVIGDLEGQLSAAVISNTGDYGAFFGAPDDIGGEVEGFRFSHFDGAFIYMFTARLDGDTLRGTFHAGLRTQTPFTAVRTTGKRHLTPPEEMTQADTAPFRFSFPDLDGRVVTSEDARFRGKVVIVDLFGTWCPTCHDAAAALKQLYTRYHDGGLEIVGIAYEVAGDTATDARMVRTFRDKLGIPWPLLLAGLPNAATQQATQPQLANFVAYPTTLFIGRDGRIKRVHAGFYGPATGEAHTALIADFGREVEALLRE